MVEIYTPVPTLTGFHAMVADAAKGRNGSSVLTTIAFE